MEGLNKSVDELIAELNKNKPINVLTKEVLQKAEKDINKKMRIFSIEQRSYFNRSVQSASKAYLTF
jgi:hypothetical protein